jgi:cytosine/adenosine deaminase-related metal-dependent hydrolase
MLVMPGSVCAHIHLYAEFARGLTRSLARLSASRCSTSELLWKLGAVLGYDDIRYSTLLGCIAAIRNGTTTLFALHASPQAVSYSLDAIAEAVLQAGLRGCLAYEVGDRLSVANGRQGIEENTRFARRAKGEPLLATLMGLGPSTVLSDGTLAAAVGAAAISNMGFHAHVAGEAHEVRDCVMRTGLHVVERLRKWGALGSRTVAADCVHVSPLELDLLQKARAWPVHNPRANMRDAVGLAPIPGMLRRGLKVCLGSDSFAAAVFREMQTAFLLHRHAGNPLEALPEEDALQLGLVNGGELASRAYGSRLGELAVGALADLVLVSYTGPSPVAKENLPQHLVLGLEETQVDTTIVAGRVLMRHRSLLTVDEEAVRARAGELVRQAWARL